MFWGGERRGEVCGFDGMVGCACFEDGGILGTAVVVVVVVVAVGCIMLSNCCGYKRVSAASF